MKFLPPKLAIIATLLISSFSNPAIGKTYGEDVYKTKESNHRFGNKNTKFILGFVYGLGFLMDVDDKSPKVGVEDDTSFACTELMLCGHHSSEKQYKMDLAGYTKGKVVKKNLNKITSAGLDYTLKTDDYSIQTKFNSKLQLVGITFSYKKGEFAILDQATPTQGTYLVNDGRNLPVCKTVEEDNLTGGKKGSYRKSYLSRIPIGPIDVRFDVGVYLTYKFTDKINHEISKKKNKAYVDLLYGVQGAIGAYVEGSIRRYFFKGGIRGELDLANGFYGPGVRLDFKNDQLALVERLDLKILEGRIYAFVDRLKIKIKRWKIKKKWKRFLRFKLWSDSAYSKNTTRVVYTEDIGDI